MLTLQEIAYRDGWKAFNDGTPRAANPYWLGAWGKDWYKGWDDAKASKNV